MDFRLSDEQEQIKSAIERLCEPFDDDYWFKKDKEGGFPFDFHQADANWAEARDVYRKRGATAPLTLRPYDQVLGFFGDMELLPPGLVQGPLWRPDGPPPPAEEIAHIGFYGGVGRKD